MIISNKKEHFEFCLLETISYFNERRIYIEKTIKLQNFLFGVFFKYYYDVKKTKKNITDFQIRISNILSYSLLKKESHLEEIEQYYVIFDESLGNF